MRTVQRTVKASVDLLFPVLGRALAETLAQYQAGVVDEDVQSAKIVLDVRDHLPDDVRIRDVGLVGLRLAARLLDLGNDSFRLGL